MNTEIFDIPLRRAGGGTETCSIYVGEALAGVNPLEQQDAWFRRERGLTIPPEVMKSFGELAKIALNENVSLSELAVYAMKEATEQEQAKADGGDS